MCFDIKVMFIPYSQCSFFLPIGFNQLPCIFICITKSLISDVSKAFKSSSKFNNSEKHYTSQVLTENECQEFAPTIIQTIMQQIQDERDKLTNLCEESCEKWRTIWHSDLERMKKLYKVKYDSQDAK